MRVQSCTTGWRRCACYFPRPEGYAPHDKTWARHPTCAYVCRNPKPANIPAYKRWNDEKCRVECVPAKPDPIPAGKRWCEDCCELSCIAQPPCSLAIPANKQWSTETCSVECKNPKPADADIPSNKQWNANTCALECKDPVPAFNADIKKWDTDTCTVVCKDSAPVEPPTGFEWNPVTCALESTCTLSAPNGMTRYQRWNSIICGVECIGTASKCVYGQTWFEANCDCLCLLELNCPAGQKENYDLCGCFKDTIGLNECLVPGERIVSQSGCFYLVFETSGNAVLSKKDGTILWSPGTSGGDQLCLEEDAAFLIYKNNQLAWNSGTDSTDATHVVLQNNGNLEVLSDDGTVYWNSNTIQSVTTC